MLLQLQIADDIGAKWAGPAAPNAARNTLTHDPVGKARWFVDSAVYQSFNLVDLTSRVWLAGVLGVVAVVGVALLLVARRAPMPLLYLVSD